MSSRPLHSRPAWSEVGTGRSSARPGFHSALCQAPGRWRAQAGRPAGRTCTRHSVKQHGQWWGQRDDQPAGLARLALCCLDLGGGGARGSSSRPHLHALSGTLPPGQGGYGARRVDQLDARTLVPDLGSGGAQAGHPAGRLAHLAFCRAAWAAQGSWTPSQPDYSRLALCPPSLGGGVARRVVQLAGVNAQQFATHPGR